MGHDRQPLCNTGNCHCCQTYQNKRLTEEDNFLLVYLIAPSPQGYSSGTDIIQCTGCGNRECRLQNYNTHGELYCLIHFNCYVPDSITAVHISTRCCYRIQVFPIFRVRCLQSPCNIAIWDKNYTAKTSSTYRWAALPEVMNLARYLCQAQTSHL